MRVLVNIGHPAHVHFFRNFIFEMRKKGNSVLITAQHKEIAINLLKAYNLEYEYLGVKYKGSVKKMVGTIYRDYLLQKVTKKYNPDILTGILDMYSAHVGKLNRIPSIVFTDTEHAKLTNKLTFPFASTICTPSCFKDDLGKKHVRYNGYHELAYLHPNYFKPNPTVLEEIGLNERDNFIIVRFVSWQASHDIGYGGLTLENKKKALKEFEKYGKVLITSESPLPSEFEKYRISVPPEKIHDLMYYATLLYGESATMASECAVLGTHAIFCDFAGRGYTDEQEDRYDLVYNFKLDEKSQSSSIEKAVSLLENDNLKREGEQKREKLLKGKIDVTKFMTDFVEGYPDTFHKYRKADEP